MAIYHPVFCEYGTQKASDDKFWYDTTVSLTSLYDCINPDNILDDSGYIGTSSGRPDSKFYDKVYIDKDGGLLAGGSYTTDDISLDIESSKLLSARGLERGLVLTNLPTLPYKSQADYITDGTLVYSNSKLTYNGSLSTDVIGDPAQYISTDTTDALQSTSTDTGTELRENALSWNVDEAKMYKYLDTDDRDNVDLTVEDYTDTAKWSVVYKGYPQSWLDYLALGKGVGFNPLLVGENGEDYIPIGTWVENKFSKKYFEINSRISHIDGVFTSTSYSSPNYINNSYTSIVSSNEFMLFSYTSANKPLAESTPLPIEQVLPKATGSNSHSVYKGAMVTNAVTGKVSVGNGSNGLESRLLENGEVQLGNVLVLSPDVLVSLAIGDIVYATGFVSSDGFYRAIADINSLSWSVSADIDNVTVFEKSSTLASTPNHNQITLDSEVSTASKWFPIEVTFPNSEIGIGVIAEELASNAGVYDGQTNEFTMLSNGTMLDLNGNTVNTKFLVKRTGCYRGDK